MSNVTQTWHRLSDGWQSRGRPSRSVSTVGPVIAPWRDATTARGITALNSWTNLLKSWGAKGAITEVGWPHEAYSTGGPDWNIWGESFLQHAQYLGIEVYGFCGDPYYGSNIRYSIYSMGSNAPTRDLYVSTSTAAPFEAAYARGLKGGVQLNFQGMGHGGSNLHPHYPPNYYVVPGQQTFDFLKARHSHRIRVSIATYYMYPQWDGPLDSSQMTMYQNVAELAANAGIEIVWCMIGEAQYNWEDPVTGAVSTLVMGQGEYTPERKADAWKKFATVAKDWPATYGYELDNEPHTIPQGPNPNFWKPWEDYSKIQGAAIREVDTTHVIYAPASYWSNLEAFPQMHTRGPWMAAYEPVRYVVHYYPDLENGTLNYAAVESQNQANGWTVNGKG